ncbi:hypothetical protein BDV95DRAFT_78852 [Massariosphaeria phaeospora]|uniref:Uncharacterized protein n=1 Tax=Massariosphaeria phaeospora TaxID=100035 RepID=A0A7C8M4Q9_9PLEO|nr:hypothetical protein BDV95DRAFT_78852 [Massariosphaeria phaeospora]
MRRYAKAMGVGAKEALNNNTQDSDFVSVTDEGVHEGYFRYDIEKCDRKWIEGWMETLTAPTLEDINEPSAESVPAQENYDGVGVYNSISQVEYRPSMKRKIAQENDHRVGVQNSVDQVERQDSVNQIEPQDSVSRIQDEPYFCKKRKRTASEETETQGNMQDVGCQTEEPMGKKMRTIAGEADEPVRMQDSSTQTEERLSGLVRLKERQERRCAGLWAQMKTTCKRLKKLVYVVPILLVRPVTQLHSSIPQEEVPEIGVDQIMSDVVEHQTACDRGGNQPTFNVGGQQASSNVFRNTLERNFPNVTAPFGPPQHLSFGGFPGIA